MRTSFKRNVAAVSRRLRTRRNQAPLLDIKDLRAHNNDPRAMRYHDPYVLIEVPTSLGRGLRTFSLAENSPHPYVRASRASIGSGNSEEPTIIHELTTYFDLVRPKSAAEWLGLEGRGIDRLDVAPPWSANFPWRPKSFSELEASGQIGEASPGTIGHRPGGEPTALGAREIAAEASRLACLTASVQRHGYQRHDRYGGDIAATVLRREDGEWRWVVFGGEHRAAVAAAVGMRRIPILPIRLVERGDVEVWPQVANGGFPVDAALEVFDRCFDGRPSPAAEDYVLLVTEHG